MGKLPNPLTNTIERDLEQARISVDILGMIKEKTKGNLNENEAEFLNKVVFESQMNYLDELKKPEEPKEADTGGGAAAESEQATEAPEGLESEPPQDTSAEPGTSDGPGGNKSRD